jgi:hypothetical protein
VRENIVIVLCLLSYIDASAPINLKPLEIGSEFVHLIKLVGTTYMKSKYNGPTLQDNCP